MGITLAVKVADSLDKLSEDLFAGRLGQPLIWHLLDVMINA